MRNISIILIVILSICSCKKDEANDPPQPDPIVYDTIFPSGYFPVFPGSYWKYIDSNSDTIIMSTDEEYKLDFYVVGGAAYVSDTFYVPRFNYPHYYNNTPIWGYDAHTGPISNAGSYPLTRIVSDTLPVGSSWTIYNWSGTAVERKIIAKETTVSINSQIYSPTIVVEEYYSQGPPFYVWINRRYFTKDVGIVKEEIFHFQDSTTNTKLIVDYQINRNK